MNIVAEAQSSIKQYLSEAAAQGKCINCTYDWTTGQGCKCT